MHTLKTFVMRLDFTSFTSRRAFPALAALFVFITASRSFAAAPSITSPLAASGTAGTAFSYQITASNTPTSFNAVGLPAGLSVDTTLGLISGTPSAGGTASVSISATNVDGTDTQTLVLTINPAAPGNTSALAASGTAGTAFSYQIAASNSPTSFNASGLPAGLSIDTSNGLISGTPGAAGTASVTLQRSQRRAERAPRRWS